MCACVCVWVWVVHVVVHSSSSSHFSPAFPCRPWTRFSVHSASPRFDIRHAYFLPLGAPVPSQNWIDRYPLFLSALRLEEKDLFPHCDPVSRVLSHVSPSRVLLRLRMSAGHPPSAFCALPFPCSLPSSSFSNPSLRSPEHLRDKKTYQSGRISACSAAGARAAAASCGSTPSSPSK
jgi:hypothetical protein